MFHERAGAAPRRVHANAGSVQPNPRSFIGKLLVRLDKRKITDAEMRRRAYQENRARLNHKVMEDSKFFNDTQVAMTQEARKEVSWRAVAESLGETDHVRVYRVARLSTLGPAVIKALEEGVINERHGRALLDLAPWPNHQRSLFRDIKKNGWSGSKAEDIAKEQKKLLQEKSPATEIEQSNGQGQATDLTNEQTTASNTAPAPSGSAPAPAPLGGAALALVSSQSTPTKTSSTIADLPALPQVVSDQLQLGCTALTDVATGISLLEIVPTDLPSYEEKIVILEKLIKRARSEINKQKAKWQSK